MSKLNKLGDFVDIDEIKPNNYSGFVLHCIENQSRGYDTCPTFRGKLLILLTALSVVFIGFLVSLLVVVISFIISISTKKESV